MEIQRKLGADLLMQFDECTPYHVDKDYTARSMEMSMRWGDRCLAEFERHDNGAQGVYGIVQGGVHEDLRQTSAAYTANRDFFGTAIGGCLGGTDGARRLIFLMQDIAKTTARLTHASIFQRRTIFQRPIFITCLRRGKYWVCKFLHSIMLRRLIC